MGSFQVCDALSILFELEKGLGFRAPITTLTGTPAPTIIQTPTKIQSQKKFVTFNIKQQKVDFLELNCKKRKNM
jgi:hypothetical protein